MKYKEIIIGSAFISAHLQAEDVVNNGDFTESTLAGAEFPEGKSFSLHSILSRVGIGAQVGTNGIGGHLTFDITNWMYVKGEISGFSHSREEFDVEGIDYEGDLDLFGAGITLNVLPFEYLDIPVVRGLRVTAGAYEIDHAVDVRSTGADANFATDYPGVDPNGALTGSVEFSNFAPYVGLGWDWRIGSEDQLTISLDAGVVFVGSAQVELENNSGNPILDPEVSQYEDDIKEETEQFELYPLVQIGVTYRF